MFHAARRRNMLIYHLQTFSHISNGVSHLEDVDLNQKGKNAGGFETGDSGEKCYYPRREFTQNNIPKTTNAATFSKPNVECT